MECKYLFIFTLYFLQYVLIETLWNVNYEKLKWYALGDSCINRNIVECKSVINASNAFREKRINRNIVECKYGSPTSGKGAGQVLIETLWNVNKQTAQQIADKYKY